ncbi:DUF1343 domain-containing protein [candidate division KSB1 bacterium]|nr:DUF1343 domain-containing protein [candidate division KSB1 bacterium]
MSIKRSVLIVSFCFLLAVSIVYAPVISSQDIDEPIVGSGIDVLLSDKIDMLAGKRVGLITNATGVTRDFVSTIDALNESPQINLVALFGPEHGVRGDIEAGKKVEDYIDPKTGIQVYSLYGSTRKPKPEMLENIDILLYDIQDIGSRAYTYIYTMAYCMEAAAERNIPFVVLDRPNPLGGNRVEGNVLDIEFSSFIGLYPIPYVYGMTVGELAKFFNEEFNIHCELTVVPMKGWHRNMLFSQTGLPWIMPSPHVPCKCTPMFVALTGCIGELGTVSIGVGYTAPFRTIAAPWIRANELADTLNSLALKGVYFRPMFYTPYYSTFTGEYCNGIEIHITDVEQIAPLEIQIHILTTLEKLFPDHDIFDTRRTGSFDKAFGTDEIRKDVASGISADQIISKWTDDLDKFIKVRANYLIY